MAITAVILKTSFWHPPEPSGDLSWKFHCGNKMTSRSKIAKIVLIRNPGRLSQPPYCFYVSSLKLLEQFSPDFTYGFLSKRYWQFVWMVLRHWTRWPPCPNMVKRLKNLLLESQESFEAESWYIASGTQGLQSLFKYWKSTKFSKSS